MGEGEFHGNKTNFVTGFILLTVGIMIFESCSISVGKKARKEIEGINKKTEHHGKVQWQRSQATPYGKGPPILKKELL